MKKQTLGTLALACATMMGPLVIGAQTNNTNPSQDTAGTHSQGGSTPGSTEAGSMSGMQGMSATATQDKQFVQEASLSDYTEITFSQLALQQSQDPQVKAYAQKMITDHQKLETEMKPGADKLGVTPATSLDSDHQQKYDALKQLSGAAFDKQYMTDMSVDHHKSLDAFKSEESSTQDKQLKPVVKKGEKVVAQHTQMADKMVTKMGGSSASGM